MTHVKSQFITSLLFAFFLNTTIPAFASQEITFEDYLEKANDHIKTHQHFSATDALKEAARLGGAKHPSPHMRLAILYYGLGLIPDAIAQGEKAVSLVPHSKWYKYDLAKFYLVNGQLDKAENEFTTLLKLDPGFTHGYYYLAEVYFQKKQYDMAWLSLTRAHLLGHQGRHLLEKLAPLSSKPVENLESTSGDDRMFRFINLSTREEAETILNNIRDGKPFHNLELEFKKDRSSSVDFGVIMLSELKKSVSAILGNSAIYADPIIIQTDRDFRVIQRIAPFNPQVWQNVLNRSPNQRENPEGLFPSRLEAFYALNSWKNSWEDGDLSRYLSAYSSDFIPAGKINPATWKKERTESFARLEFIRIELVNPIIEMLAQTRIVITFKQIYETETGRNVVMKAVTMKMEEEKWRIIDERIIKNLRE